MRSLLRKNMGVLEADVCQVRGLVVALRKAKARAKENAEAQRSTEKSKGNDAS